MNQEQFFDSRTKTWYLVFLPKKWTWEDLDKLTAQRGVNSTNWEKTNGISLFEGDLQGNVGDIYVKVG